MIYIYSCYAGTHTSSIAAAVHLKMVQTDRIPSKDEILNIQYFNKLERKDMGRLIYRGTDDEGNKVYTVGRGTAHILLPCIEDLIKILHNECGFNEKIIISNMIPSVTLTMSIGGICSRVLRLSFIGVPFLVIGAKQGFNKIVDIVKNAKEAAKETKENVLVLMNDK